MSRTVAEILDEALGLPEPARAELAELLAVSLSVIPRAPHSAWAEAIRRRSAEVDSPERTYGPIANGLPHGITSLEKSEVDAEGRLLAITDEERRAQWAMRLASLEAAWGIHDDRDEHVTDEMWDEVMRNLGVDPTIVRGLES